MGIESSNVSARSRTKESEEKDTALEGENLVLPLNSMVFNEDGVIGL